MNQKIIALILFMICLTASYLIFTGSGFAAQVTLVDDGRANSVIVISNDASPSELHGAKELQMFIQMISGAYLPIYRDNESIDGTMILVGDSEKLRRVDNRLDIKGLGDEGFIMKTAGGHLILAGGRLRGSMYAVYTFLEEKLGCRWYSSTVSYIPRMNTIEVGNLNETQIPDFEYREPFWKDAFDADWAARNKCNSSAAALDVTRGGKVNWPGVHTFYPLMPPDVWFDDHPEYFSHREARRRWEYAQFCLTNPEVMKIMTQKVLYQMENRPDDILFEISQNDWGGWCECGDCKEIDDREEAHSGTMIPFVNAIAERTEKVFPKKYITTLAYSYTEKAPKYASPRHNVVIRLCNIVACDVHPLTCEGNKRFQESMAGWAPKTPKMHVWDYVTNFHHYLMPLPNVKGVIADIPWMLKNGVDGLFEQGCYTTRCGSLSELQAYLEAKLLWNTKRDADEIIDDFLHGYFGRAAVPIRAYIDLMHKRVTDENIHHSYRVYHNTDFLNRDFLDKADFYFDEAEQLADNHDIAHRVAQWRLNLRYAKLGRPIVHYIEDDVYKPIKHDEKYADLEELEKFIQDCHIHGVEELSEGRGYSYRYNHLRANNGSFRVVSLENPYIKVQVVPGMGGRVLQILHKKSGTKLLAPADVKERNYPCNGGFQESPSDAEFYEHTVVRNEDGQKLTLQAFADFRRSHNAFYITREISVPADKPEIHFKYILEAQSEVHGPRRISTSPVFDFVQKSGIKVGVGGSYGKFEAANLPEADDEGRQFLRFVERDIPDGAVCIIDEENNIGIINEYDKTELQYCSIGIDNQNRSSIRLEGKQEPLEKGDKLELRHTFKIVDDVQGLIRD